MVLRIHFTVEDLARTRVAGSPWPVLEASFAVRRLRGHPARADPWRRRALRQLAPLAQMIFDLTPPAGYTPCFLGADRPGSADEQLHRIAATPRRRVDDDMAYFAARHRVPAWARRLADDPPTLRRVADALGHIHAVTVAPYWSQVAAWAVADRAVRARQLLDGGVEALLASLHPPRIHWRPPVLRVRTLTDVDCDLHLGGRGLLLIPSVFGTAAPTVSPDAEPQPFLTYPVPAAHPILLTTDGGARVGQPPTAVAALIGDTRAAVLQAVAANPGCTTSELAATTGVSPSSASEHATVLRAAALITTTRYRRTALHTVTATGAALLGGATVPATGPGEPTPGRASLPVG